MEHPLANIVELKEELDGCRLRFKQNPDRSITINNLTRGTTMSVYGLRMKERGNHVELKDHSGNWLILPQDPRVIRKNAKWAASVSLLGLLASILAGVISNYSLFHFKPTESEIDQRLKEIEIVKESLQTLDSYLREQESDLKTLYASLSSMKKEKENLEAIISTDQKRVDAIIAQTNRTRTKEKWIERIVSFCMGIFSSLTAAFLWNYFQARRKENEQVVPAYGGQAVGPNG